MSFRFLLDEQVEPQVGRYLDREGHDVVHVREIDELGAGVDDHEVTAYSAATDRYVLTNDDDFHDELMDDPPAVFYFPNQRLSADTITSIIGMIDRQFTGAELEHETVVKVVEGWL